MEEEKKPHYTCNSCGGVSGVPKPCDTEGCDMAGEPLMECNCDDPMHLGKLSE